MLNTNKSKKVAKPSFLKSRKSSGEIHLTWWRVDFVWTIFYLTLASIFISTLIIWEPDIMTGYYILFWRLEQILLFLAAIGSLWGLLGAFFNAHRVIIANKYLKRVTYPFCLYERKKTIQSNLVHQIINDKRPSMGTYRHGVLLISKSSRIKLVETPCEKANSYVHYRIEKELEYKNKKIKEKRREIAKNKQKKKKKRVSVKL